MAVSNSDGLAGYFSWLEAQLNQGAIVSESDLERAVELPPFNHGFATLLQLLGYDRSMVQPQYKIQLGTRVLRVDYLVSVNGSAWMLDVKAPMIDCLLPKYAIQMTSYLKQESVPLGLLFSGRQAAIYVNPELRRVQALRDELQATYKIDLRQRAVRTAELGQPRDLVALVGLLSMSGGGKLPDRLAVALTRELRDRKEREAQELVRKRTIDSVLGGMLRNPSPTVVSAILQAYPELNAAIARSSDVRDWLRAQSKTCPSTPPQAPGQPSSTAAKLNPRIRDLIAQVCATPGLGYRTLAGAGIRELNLRDWGAGDQGFRAVPAGPGVPPGLCVQGVDTPRGTRIIFALEQLLQSKT
jgi:hypothetical protein